jgi:hypothetical protein
LRLAAIHQYGDHIQTRDIQFLSFLIITVDQVYPFLFLGYC